MAFRSHIICNENIITWGSWILGKDELNLEEEVEGDILMSGLVITVCICRMILSILNLFGK